MHIQMARELGMNPRKFGKLANHHQQPWKAPLPIFIEDIYFKRFGKYKPDVVLTIKEVTAARRAKKEAKKLRREARKAHRMAADVNDSALTELGPEFMQGPVLPSR